MHPGGDAAPGVFTAFAAVLALGAVAAWRFGDGWGPYLGAAVGVIAGLLFLYACLGSGFQPPSTGYQGSRCPGCGQHSRIWPWNL